MALHASFLLIGAILSVMVIVAIVIVAVLASRPQAPSPTGYAPMHETPLQILDRRLAAGEINAEEYKRARDLLGGGGKS
jgi:putative membrane protein